MKILRICATLSKQKAPNRVLFVLAEKEFGYELVLPKAKQFVVAVRNVRQHFGTVKSGARTICRAPPVAVDRLESALYPVLSLAKNKIYSGHPTGCFLFWAEKEFGAELRYDAVSVLKPPFGGVF